MVDKTSNDPVIETVEVSRFRINRVVEAYLEELAKSGLYGERVTDVIRSIVQDSIREMVRSDQLHEIKWASAFAPKTKQDEDEGSIGEPTS